jgi:hypothetical protein
MFITKKGLSRRTILRGMGAGLALAAARCDGTCAHADRVVGRQSHTDVSASCSPRWAG